MSHRTIQRTVGGRATRWRESGDPQRGVVVLIHAFPLSSAMWEPQFDAFPGWRVIAPDLRGFRGPDSAPAERPGDPTMDEYAIDIEHVLDALDVSQAVIGGLSMGGYVTFALFRRAPSRFRGLILADTRAAADTEEGRQGRRKMLHVADEQGTPAIADDMLPKLLGPTTRREQPHVEQQVRRMIEANSPDAIKAAVTAMMTRADSTPLLATIQCPTLVTVGEEDALTPVAASRDMQQSIRGASLVTLPHAGHLSNLERAADFNTAVGRFLGTLST
jgi:pimeloyl-ACP methyl ester carboxylesterase